MASGSIVKVFATDLARFNAAFEVLGAVRVVDDEGEDIQYIDPTGMPTDLLRAYKDLLVFGAANGLV